MVWNLLGLQAEKLDFQDVGKLAASAGPLEGFGRGKAGRALGLGCFCRQHPAEIRHVSRHQKVQSKVNNFGIIIIDWMLTEKYLIFPF